MITQEQKNFFEREGYLLVPDVFSDEEVARARATLRPKFDAAVQAPAPGDSPTGLKDIFSRHPDLRWILFHEGVLTTLREILGDDFIVLRETPAHLNNFGSWHRDSGGPQSVGLTFQMEPDYLMVNAAFYLQDNHPEYGGGLDVVPGSHQVGSSVGRVLSKLRGRLRDSREADPQDYVSIPNKARDLVIFHFRANHRSTPTKVSPPPREHEKLAIFIGCSRNNEHVRAYHEFLLTRPDAEHLQDFSYPEDYRLEAKERGVNLF